MHFLDTDIQKRGGKMYVAFRVPHSDDLNYILNELNIVEHIKYGLPFLTNIELVHIQIVVHGGISK